MPIRPEKPIRCAQQHDWSKNYNRTIDRVACEKIMKGKAQPNEDKADPSHANHIQRRSEECPKVEIMWCCE